jgi:hypothetical protein
MSTICSIKSVSLKPDTLNDMKANAWWNALAEGIVQQGTLSSIGTHKQGVSAPSAYLLGS